jgi:two-component system sensor histidine kinase PilS (NtrC family)
LSPLLKTLRFKLLPPLNSFEYATEVRPWYPVRLLALYRLFIALLIASLFYSGLSEISLGQTHPGLFGYSVSFYVGLSCLWLLLIHFHQPGYYIQTSLQILGDILLITLMMHASGGFGSGLGILLVVNIGAAGLLLSSLAGFFFAALGSILLLLEQVFTHLVSDRSQESYPQVAALGAAFLGIAALVALLKRRVQESEQLAEQRELDIENLAQLNEHIIQQMQNGVVVIDNEQQIRLLNRAARMQLNIHDDRIPLPLDAASPELVVRFNLWQNNPDEKPARIRSPGSPFELQPHFIPLGREGSAGTLSILEDTTPYSREFQNIKLASLGRLTASIAHEIRNPLSAIQHAAQLLAESTSLDQNDKRLTEIINQQTERMNTIISNIMQLSIKESVTPKPITLDAWLTDFAAEFRAHNHLADGNPTVELKTDSLVCFFDPSQLHQIVTNLCTNSLKYGQNKRGYAAIRLAAGIDPQTDAVYLDICDDGKGVPPEIQDQIFEPFFSSGNSSPGLGLYIVRELCEFNHAKIRYIDQPKQGATFRIQFSMGNEAAATDDITRQLAQI